MKWFFAATDREALGLRRIAHQEDLPTVGNRLMVELAIFTVAAYRVMLDQRQDAADAQAAIADVGWDAYGAMMRRSSLPSRLISCNPGRRLRGTICLLLRFPFGAPGAPTRNLTMIRKDDSGAMTRWPQRFMPISFLLVSACAALATPCPLQNPAPAPTASTSALNLAGGVIDARLRAMGCATVAPPARSAVGQPVPVSCADGRVGYAFGQ